jgi:hypothetical protein
VTGDLPLGFFYVNRVCWSVIARNTSKWVTVSSKQLMACANTGCTLMQGLIRDIRLRPSFRSDRMG